MDIRDRIIELRRVPASELEPNPSNWRIHPDNQRDAMSGILSEIGYADALIARQREDGSLQLIDGHLRRETTPDMEVPVLVTDLSESEAKLLLATLDPLAGLAETDTQQLDALLREINTGDQSVADMLEELSESAGMYNVDAVDLPELSSSDREPFQQMTFTLHDSQAETVKAAIEKAKAAGDFSGSPNENSNGNALARVAEAYRGAC